MLFNIDCLQFVDSIAVGEKSVYHQISNPNSAIVDAWNYHRRAFNLLIVRGLLNSNMEKEYQDLYDSCIHNLKSQLWISLKVPISLREKLLYIAWAIIPGFMSRRCKNKARIKAKDN